MRPRILLLDQIAEKGKEDFLKFSDVIDGCSLSKKEIHDIVKDFDGIIIKSGNIIDKQLLKKAVKLKFIARAGSGVDNIDLSLIDSQNIKLFTSPEGNADSVAEYTIGMMILLSHKLLEAHAGAKMNNFQRHMWQGRNIQELTVGIIGLGTIGEKVVSKMNCLVNSIIGYDPYKCIASKYDKFKQIDDLETLFRVSDIITLHVPLNNETEHLINLDNVHKIKRGCILINTARGKIVEENALLKAFEDGIINCAALDTLSPDPDYNKSLNLSTYSHFLINHPKVFYTPHIAAGTKDALEEVSINLSHKIKEFLKL